MSSALVRQALEFVDQEEWSGKRSGRRAGPGRRSEGQGTHPYKRKNKRAVTSEATPSSEDNVKKLLALSRPTADPKIAQKIVERAVKGKPLLEKIEVKKEEQKSILFPEEDSFKQCEKEYICS